MGYKLFDRTRLSVSDLCLSETSFDEHWRPGTPKQECARMLDGNP